MNEQEKIPQKDALTLTSKMIDQVKQLPYPTNDFYNDGAYVINIIRAIEEYQAVLLLQLYNEDMIE